MFDDHFFFTGKYSIVISTHGKPLVELSMTGSHRAVCPVDARVILALQWYYTLSIFPITVSLNDP